MWGLEFGLQRLRNLLIMSILLILIFSQPISVAAVSNSNANINYVIDYTTWYGAGVNKGLDIMLDDNNNIYIVGSTTSFSNDSDNTDILVLKYDSNGNLIWNRTWGGKHIDKGLAAVTDSNGFIYVLARSWYLDSPSITMLKYDRDGNLIWNKSLAGPSKFGCGMILGNDGNLYVVGYEETEDRIHDGLLMKVSTEGEIIWERTYSGKYVDRYQDIAIDENGDIYVVGQTELENVDRINILVSKYNAGGDLLWNKSFDIEETSSQAVSVTVDESGNIYVIGNIGLNSTFANDILVLKLDNDGNILWYKVWDGGYFDKAYDAVLDRNGNVYVIGFSEEYNSVKKEYITNLLLLKFDANGNLLWQKTWNNDWEYVEGKSAVIDDQDDIFIVGNAYPENKPEEWNIVVLCVSLDVDNDGLGKWMESKLGTDPNKSDSDGDGFLDSSDIDPLNPLVPWGFFALGIVLVAVTVHFIRLRKSSIRKIS